MTPPPDAPRDALGKALWTAPWSEHCPTHGLNHKAGSTCAQCFADRATVAVLSVRDLEDLAARTIAWALARKDVNRLHRERNASECEHEPDLDMNDDADASYAHGNPNAGPCWKPYWVHPPGPVEPDLVTAPREEWCAACVKRQALHEEYLQATKRAGRLQTALIRVATRTTGRKP